MRDERGKLPTPDSHVDNEDGTKTMYITEKGMKRKRRKKNRKKKGGWRNTTVERKEEP